MDVWELATSLVELCSCTKHARKRSNCGLCFFPSAQVDQSDDQKLVLVFYYCVSVQHNIFQVISNCFQSVYRKPFVQDHHILAEFLANTLLTQCIFKSLHGKHEMIPHCASSSFSSSFCPSPCYYYYIFFALQGKGHVDDQCPGRSCQFADEPLQVVETSHYGHIRPRRYGPLLR